MNTTPGWFKSSYSNPAQSCVEVRFDHDAVQVRDSKDHGLGPVVTVPVAHWPGFLAEATGSARAGSNRALRIEDHADGATTLRCPVTGTALSYTAAEWTAFVAGAVVGEFAPALPAT